MVSKRVEDQGGWSHGGPLQRCDLICDELDDEAVLFDPRLGSVHRFNAMTLFIWQRCDGAHAAHALAEAVAERYAIDTQQALLHVERVLSGFDELGLLDDSPGPPDPSPWRGPTRRAVLGVGMAKLVFVAPVISTFWAASAYGSASNPIHAGSPLGAGACKNIGFSCAVNNDCCGSGLDNSACNGGTCCVKHNKNGCLSDADCCDFPTDTCNAGQCN